MSNYNILKRAWFSPNQHAEALWILSLTNDVRKEPLIHTEEAGLRILEFEISNEPAQLLGFTKFVLYLLKNAIKEAQERNAGVIKIKLVDTDFYNVGILQGYVETDRWLMQSSGTGLEATRYLPRAINDSLPSTPPYRTGEPSKPGISAILKGIRSVARTGNWEKVNHPFRHTQKTPFGKHILPCGVSGLSTILPRCANSETGLKLPEVLSRTGSRPLPSTRQEPWHRFLTNGSTDFP